MKQQNRKQTGRRCGCETGMRGGQRGGSFTEGFSACPIPQAGGAATSPGTLFQLATSRVGGTRKKARKTRKMRKTRARKSRC